MKKTSPGFTLVETLVAISILLIAIVGPFYAAQRSIFYSATARDELIASSLAQEGAEYIYFLRNNNYLATRSWLTYIDRCAIANGCAVDPSQHDQTQSDPTTNSLVACSASGCAPLRISSSGLYTLSGAYPTTRFTRKLTVTQIAANEVQLNVTVTWETLHTLHNITVTENLYDWL